MYHCSFGDVEGRIFGGNISSHSENGSSFDVARIY